MKAYISLLCIRLLINFADSLFYIVSIWMISQQYDDPMVLGAAVCLFVLPEVFIMFVGPVIDRVNPKPLLLISLLIQITASAMVVMFFESMNIVRLLTLIFVSSFSSTLSYPLEETVIPQIVERRHVVLANSIFTTAYELVNSLFDAISGALLLYFSFVNLYRMNILVVLISFIPLMMFSVRKDSKKERNKQTYLEDLKEGVAYMKENKTLLIITAPLVVINMMNAINAVAIPSYCEGFEDPQVMFSGMMAAAGVGGIVGGFASVPLSKVIPSGKLVAYAMVLKGAFWASATLLHRPFLSIILFGCSYFLGAVANSMFTSWFQLLPPVSLLGRINTIADSLIAIAMPLGGLVGGVVLRAIDGKVALMVYGLLSCIISLYFVLSKEVFRLPLMDSIGGTEDGS